MSQRSLCGAGSPVSKEYQLKVAFLYNFTKFVEWPAARFADETSPIVIGVLAENPFGDELEKAIRGRKVYGREIVVRVLPTLAEATSAHLVFVSDTTVRPDTLDALHRAHVLTVGESPSFAAAGGVITFSLEQDKLRFSINLTSSQRAQLKLSAQLLKLANVVRQ